jgi:hypothetical protein
MEAMNAIGFAPHGFHRPTRRARLRRVDTVTLASSVSILALLVTTVLHSLAGVGESPLVIGTIVVASIAGWVNAALPGAQTPADGGRELDDDFDEFDLLDQAA